MACALRLGATRKVVTRKVEKSGKLQRHIQRTPTKRIGTPPMETKAEG